jgi:uncharacterized membrane protein YraQ (UPF0718 family)
MQEPSAPSNGLRARLPGYLAALALWVLAWLALKPAADGLAYTLLGLSPDTAWGSGLAFFIYETPKVLLLLVLIAFGVGVLRSFVTPERARRWLAGRRQGVATVLAALLGVLTPFCSCSAVPLFMGLLTAGVPLGVTLAYLVSAPLVNEVALLLLWGLAGWKVALLYLATGLGLATATGFVLMRLKPEGWVQPWVLEQLAAAEEAWDPSFAERLDYGRDNMLAVLQKVWPWIAAGVAVGAFVHGWVPQTLLERVMGREAWWSLPLVVLMGVPLYANAAGMIPLVSALLAKGAALGTVLAFMMAVIGLSAPEAVILKQVMRPRLLALFFGTVAFGILLVGYLFNLVF